MNARMYRGTWLLVGVPLLAAAFSVGRPDPLPAPAVPPTFDGESARVLAEELATSYPSRVPGSQGAVDWIVDRFRVNGFRPELRSFEAEIPGLGRRRLTNVVATAAGRSSRAIVVLAHRDNTGAGPGANDNASGVAAQIELSRAYARAPGGAGGAVRPSHTLIFLSTDAGAFGAVGAACFAADPAYRGRIAAVVVLDSIAGPGAPRLELAGDTPRSPSPLVVRTAAERLLEQTGSEPGRAGTLRQLIDLGLPFSLLEQAPFVSQGTPAVTLTTAGDRPPEAFGDTADRLSAERLGQVGRATQQLVASLDEGLDVAPASAGYLYLGPRIVRGWAIQLVLIAAALPFLAAAVDLFARCRRRRIRLAPALRSLRSRLAFWLFVGAAFLALDRLGAWPGGVARPLSPESDAARTWPLLGLGVLAAAAAAGWLLARERLLPRRPVTQEERLAGATAALLGLGLATLLVVATNPYALLFLLPSLHAWIWLPQVAERRVWTRAAVYAAGLAGPLLLVVSFAARYGLGLDAPWYLAALVAVGYVEPAPVVLLLAWAAVAAQLAAVATGRYAPYPAASERPPRGPVRELVERARVALGSRRRADPRLPEAIEA